MDFRDKKKSHKKSHFEEEEQKHKRMEKRKSNQATKEKKSKKRSSELTTGLLSGENNEPRSFLSHNNDSDAYNYKHRESDCYSVASSVTTADKDNGTELVVPEDYTWDFVVVLPMPDQEDDDEDEEEGKEKVLPALEPSEVTEGGTLWCNIIFVYSSPISFYSVSSLLSV